MHETMLADESAILHQLENSGPEVAGRHWAALTAEALMSRYRSAVLPKTFPALLRDAERLVAEAGQPPEAATSMYTEAGRMWVRLAGARNRPGSM